MVVVESLRMLVQANYLLLLCYYMHRPYHLTTAEMSAWNKMNNNADIHTCTYLEAKMVIKNVICVW